MLVFQVPRQGPVLAVNLEGVESFMAASVTSRFERCERTILEATEERTRVIDMNRFSLPTLLMVSLFDECFGHRRYRPYRAVKPLPDINTMGEEVAGNSAPRDFGVQSPQSASTLRNIC